MTSPFVCTSVFLLLSLCACVSYDIHHSTPPSLSLCSQVFGKTREIAQPVVIKLVHPMPRIPRPLPDISSTSSQNLNSSDTCLFVLLFVCWFCFGGSYHVIFVIFAWQINNSFLKGINKDVLYLQQIEALSVTPLIIHTR